MEWDKLTHLYGFVRAENLAVYTARCPQKPSTWAVYLLQIGPRGDDPDERLFFKSEEVASIPDLEEVTVSQSGGRRSAGREI